MCRRTENSSFLGHCVKDSFRMMMLEKNRLFLTSECTDGVKEYGSGGHVQCHNISNSLNKQYFLGEIADIKVSCGVADVLC